MSSEDMKEREPEDDLMSFDKRQVEELERKHADELAESQKHGDLGLAGANATPSWKTAQDDYGIKDFVPAERKGTNVLIALAGGTQSGKTYSAMLLARGLAQGKPFFMLDTETNRGKHYADEFLFEHKRLVPPFSPKRYLEHIQPAVKRGFPVIVIDSFSHEWSGQGGVLEMADNSSRKPPSNWIIPKSEHWKLVNSLLQADAHLIFCLRAKKPTNVVPDPDKPGKTKFVEEDWTPISEKDLIYEMTISFTFEKTSPGMVNLRLPHKLVDAHRLLFPEGQRVTEAAGAALARWCNGEDIVAPNAELWTEARNMANTGTTNLKIWAQALGEEDAVAIRTIKKELWETAQRADQNMEGETI